MACHCGRAGNALPESWSEWIVSHDSCETRLVPLRARHRVLAALSVPSPLFGDLDKRAIRLSSSARLTAMESRTVARVDHCNTATDGNFRAVARQLRARRCTQTSGSSAAVSAPQELVRAVRHTCPSGGFHRRPSPHEDSLRALPCPRYSAVANSATTLVRHSRH
jgi:hypothetical protein